MPSYPLATPSHHLYQFLLNAQPLDLRHPQALVLIYPESLHEFIHPQNLQFHLLSKFQLYLQLRHLQTLPPDIIMRTNRHCKLLSSPTLKNPNLFPFPVLLLL